MSAPKQVLVISTRRIGDVLLTTPLIRSLRRAWPDTAIDALVFAGTAPVLAGNPDIRQVLTVAERPGARAHLALMARIWRRYDLAVSTLTSDRPTLYAWLAGRQRVGFIDDSSARWLKARMLDQTVAFDNLGTHTVRMNLALAARLGIEPVGEVVPPRAPAGALLSLAPFAVDREPYAVLHPFPRFAYKQWRTEGWLALAAWLQARAVRVVLTGGADPDECAYAQTLMADLPSGSVNLVGQLTLAQTATLLARAIAYVGPDTATTHMAAAANIPTVALFGPSNPVKWGPWPASWPATSNPWGLRGTQLRGNVALVQGSGDCVPCLLEGCDRHQGSDSACLKELPAATVIAALEALLAQSAPVR